MESNLLVQIEIRAGKPKAGTKNLAARFGSSIYPPFFLFEGFLGFIFIDKPYQFRTGIFITFVPSAAIKYDVISYISECLINFV